MKNKTRLASYLALCAMALPALAQSPATPRAAPPAPPAPPAPGAAAIAPLPPKRDPVTFLGVVTVPASRAMIEQLGLPPGFGLVVESVESDSPADKAGIKRYDLLTAFGDQKLASTSQLTSLVRASNEGADVVFTVLRKGQEMKVTAKLIKKASASGGNPYGHYIKDMMRQSGLPQGWDFNFGTDGSNGKSITIRRPGEGGGERTTTVDMNRARIIIRDDKGEIEVSGEPGKRSITARKPDGSVIFQGPVNTEEERKKVPADLLEKLGKIERDRNASVEPDRERARADRERARADREQARAEREVARAERGSKEEADDDDNDFEFDFDIGGDFIPPIPPVPPVPPMPVEFGSDPVT